MQMWFIACYLVDNRTQNRHKTFKREFKDKNKKTLSYKFSIQRTGHKISIVLVSLVVNPGGWGVATPRFWAEGSWGVAEGVVVAVVGSWTGRKILLYHIMYRKHVRK